VLFIVGEEGQIVLDKLLLLVHLFEVQAQRVDGGTTLPVELLVFDSDTFVIFFSRDLHLV